MLVIVWNFVQKIFCVAQLFSIQTICLALPFNDGIGDGLCWAILWKPHELVCWVWDGGACAIPCTFAKNRLPATNRKWKIACEWNSYTEQLWVAPFKHFSSSFRFIFYFVIFFFFFFSKNICYSYNSCVGRNLNNWYHSFQTSVEKMTVKIDVHGGFRSNYYWFWRFSRRNNGILIYYLFLNSISPNSAKFKQLTYQ